MMNGGMAASGGGGHMGQMGGQMGMNPMVMGRMPMGPDQVGTGCECYRVIFTLFCLFMNTVGVRHYR